jgi:Zn-dependent protease
MLLEPERTAYDLSWRMFGTPVRVHPFFWLFSAIFGWDLIQIHFGYVLLWIACVFVSILVHEFGHIWAGRLFGSHGSVVLYSFGGLAVGANHLAVWWQRVLVSLAGPGIQLALYGLLRLLLEQLPAEHLLRLPPWAIDGIGMLLFINLYWPLFNLLPIWPLDGGMVSREIFERANPDQGLKFSLGLSMITAAIVAINAVAGMNKMRTIPYLPTSMYAAILFGLLAYESYILLRHVSQRPWDR